MKLYRSLLAATMLLAASQPIQAKDLYVNPTGSDAVSYANNSGLTPWATLHKASAEARSGDIVFVAAGTYPCNANTPQRSRFQVLYNPAQPNITFRALSRVTLTCHTAGPLIGAEGRTDVKWIGHFYINEAQAPTVPDTGAVVFFQGHRGLVSGIEVAGANRDFEDNHNGIRVEQSNNVTVEHNNLYGFRSGGSAGENDAAIMLYDSNDTVIQNNWARDTGTGVYIKGAHPGMTQLRTIVRFNLFGPNLTRMGVGIVDANESRIYQNIIFGNTGNSFGALVYYGLGGGPDRTWVYNNTVHNNDIGVLFRGSAASWEDAQFHNNLITGGRLALGSFEFSSVATFFANRNVYNGQSERFASLGATNLTFLQWQAQGQDAGGSTVAPGYVDTQTFKLSATSPVRTIGRDVNTGAVIPIGAYITGDEVIGPSTGTTQPPPPPPPPPPCTYTIAPTSTSVSASGGTGSVVVTPSAATCTFTATSNTSWLTVAVSGTSVGYTVASNTGAARTGTASIAGITFTVNQAAAPAPPPPPPPVGCVDGTQTIAYGTVFAVQLSDGSASQRQNIATRIQNLQNAGFRVELTAKSTYTALWVTCPRP